jgi:hypothetical protein
LLFGFVVVSGHLQKSQLLKFVILQRRINTLQAQEVEKHARSFMKSLADIANASEY